MPGRVVQRDVDDVGVEGVGHLVADELDQRLEVELRRQRPGRRSLTIASSAARWRVSSTRRAFSRATLRLAASVVSRRTSASLKASVRSRFWSEMTTATLVAARSAARRRADCGGFADDRGLAASPVCPAWLDVVDDERLGASRCTLAGSRLRSAIGSSGSRTPRSIVYGKRISSASKS